MRAAMRAVIDANQAAVLVPTTILAEQHLETFMARFQNHPVHIEALDRFRKPKETKQIIKETVDEKLEGYKVIPATQKASPTQITKIETQLDKISKSLVRLCSKLQQLRVLSADDVKHILE